MDGASATPALSSLAPAEAEVHALALEELPDQQATAEELGWPPLLEEQLMFSPGCAEAAAAVAGQERVEALLDASPD